MRDRIYKRIWQLSPTVDDSDTYKELLELTHDLVALYRAQGRLDENPFASARARTLSLRRDDLRRELEDATCIVTGGIGCVGSHLVRELLDLGVKRVIILDISKKESEICSSRILRFHCDIRNHDIVSEVFEIYKPSFVFHTAAQRSPGEAELHVQETVETNVLGTLSIVQACVKTESVKQCIFSSTGKASRYFTEEVYAATKKICEWIIEAYSSESHVKFSVARFTHIIDNSLMDEQLASAAHYFPFVSIHSPGKYVTAQNAGEAACLMLNAIMHAEANQCNLLVVKNLEWPVESLEIALFHILESGRDVPLIFSGNPLGYSEKFFRGQLNWAFPSDLNLLVNVYEVEARCSTNPAGDIVISRILGCDPSTLRHVLSSIAMCTEENLMKKTLASGLMKLVKTWLRQMPNEQTVNILNWSIDPEYLEHEKITISDYGAIIPLMVESLGDTEFCQQLAPPLSSQRKVHTH